MKNVKPVKKVIEKELANDADIKVGKTTVSITNRDKIYWPKLKITKGMMIDYYQSIASYILPYLKDRPQSLKRNPGGIADKGFYHKDAGENAPSFVKSFKVHSESSNKQIDYIICNDKATLAYLNNLGCIELNPWHSTTKKPDKPDYLIIDIDPSEKNNFNQVIDAANAFKKILDKAGATCFCKTSGASGLHIYIPLGKKYSYEQGKEFAHLICMMVNDELPDFTTLERNLKKRGNKKIYLDYLQNSKGQTIASVYSLRPREEATVSMPLLWKEVKHGMKPTDFTIHNAVKRIAKTADIFKGILGPGIDIHKCLVALNKES
jgi:bifunctional non-homologous end joining protein LigD